MKSLRNKKAFILSEKNELWTEMKSENEKCTE